MYNQILCDTAAVIKIAKNYASKDSVTEIMDPLNK